MFECQITLVISKIKSVYQTHPSQGCLRWVAWELFVVTLEKSYRLICSHCLQSTSKSHWIHMNNKQSLIQFCCQKVHMHVMKCQLTWEVWAWPGCSLHMTKYCCKQSKAFTTGHAGVCMMKAITQRESLRQVSANLRGLSLTQLYFAYDKILSQVIWSIHDWLCRCLHDKVITQLTCFWYTTDKHQPFSHGIQHSSLQRHPHQDSIHQQGCRGTHRWGDYKLGRIEKSIFRRHQDLVQGHQGGCR